VWDFAGDGAPISAFWRAVRDVAPGHPGESTLAGARAGHLAELFAAAGLAGVEEEALEVEIEHETFDAWWEPFELGVGPAGAYASTLDATRLEAIRERCRAWFPDEPFTVPARAWAARGAPA
jgi:hypothetical protein